MDRKYNHITYLKTMFMKLLTVAVLGLATSTLSSKFSAYTPNEECPKDVEVLCIDDINKGYPVCEQAAEEKGKDIPADIECMKFFAKIDKDCWPCICLVAEVNKWHIKGCN